MGPQISAAVEAYAKDVRECRFPGPEHTTAPAPRVVTRSGLPAQEGDVRRIDNIKLPGPG